MSARAYTAGALPRGSSASRSPQGGVRAPLIAAALCALALVLVWAVATHVEAFRVRDAELLRHFALIEGERINRGARVLLHLLNPVQYTIWAVAIVLFALARGEWRLAPAVAVVMALAPLSAEVLKPLLAHPHVGFGLTVGAASWPSGHATAASALALSAVVVTPPRWRMLAAALAAVFMLAVGIALLIRVWHMPSDVLGGCLLSMLWTALGLTAVRASERSRPARGA
jgi:membrane-associated phospholipid phosphatase